MKIIAIEKEIPESNPEMIKKFSEDEALEADKTSAILILESNNLAEANDMLQRLPFVKWGLISFELIPLKPYPGFSRLFKAQFSSD